LGGGNTATSLRDLKKPLRQTQGIVLERNVLKKEKDRRKIQAIAELGLCGPCRGGEIRLKKKGLCLGEGPQGKNASKA